MATTKYSDHFDEVLNFLYLYKELINCHMVDFITDELWNKCLPKNLRVELEETNISDLLIKNHSHSEYNKFIDSTTSLSLESCTFVWDLQDLSKLCSLNELCVKNNKYNPELMKAKKYHEVEALGGVIAKLRQSILGLVIDVGAGKAYLSMYLAMNYEIPVLAVDSSKICQYGAMKRREKIVKKNSQFPSSVQYVLEKVNENTDWNEMIKLKFPRWKLNNNLIFTGLHTCGSLVQSVMKCFLNSQDAKYLCVVPCCYHLIDEFFSNKCNFSKNAKMLAQQSIHKSSKNHLNFSPTLFFRAILQVVLREIGMNNARVGRGGPSNNFSSYAKWALTKLGVQKEKIPSPNSLEEIYQSHLKLMDNFQKFQILRIHLASVIETAILLDSIIQLENSGKCYKFGILQIFDPVLSPRCYAIVALK